MANSYKDPSYDELDASTSAKLGLPEGLLTGIRVRGERSNADQVSEANARTVYQIIPETRDAAIKKYGIDPYLSPENASLVAGHLLKDSLDRNKGDVSAAVSEYHGGTDRKGWGSRTSAYVNRVMTGLAPEARKTRRLAEELNVEASGPSLAKVFQAYTSGAMDPQSAAELEADVAAGRLIPPRGVKMKAPAGVDPIQGVLNAYYDGRMTADEKAEFEGDVAAGRVKLPPGVQLSSRASQIPGQDGQPVEPTPTPPEPGLLDKLAGKVEAPLSIATGLTTGAAGMVAGAVGGLAGSVLNGDFGTQQGVQNVQRAAEEGAAALTYTPRSQSGQEAADAMGRALQQTIPVAPLTAQLAGAGRAAATAGRAANDTRAAMLAQVKAKVEAAAARRAAANEAATPTPGTMGSVGAAGTDMATLRHTLAEDLPVPVKLTKGQATRDFEQQRFEGEMAKDPTRGKQLRDFTEEQSARAVRNFDVFVDQTGAQATDPVAIGDAVTAALQRRQAADKTKVRVAYAKADKSPEATEPVNPGAKVNIGAGEQAMTSSPIDFLNSKPSGLATTALADHARQYAIKLGIAQEVDGKLQPVTTNVKTMEAWRREINAATNQADPVQIRDATVLKKLIDAQTEPVSGPLYKQARTLRKIEADRYENFGLASDLLGMKKGTNDAKVAAEQVFQRAVVNAPMADVKQLGRLLKAGGDEGRQAWKELQGATLRHIRDQATKNVGQDSKGNQLLSPKGLDDAMKQLDRAGKLDYMFGRKGAEQLRAINELAKIIKTTPPGALNHSNTASVILSALGGVDLVVSGMGGMPLPILSGLRILTTHVKDRQIQKRINEALGIKPEPKKPKPANGVPTRNSPATSRAPESRTVH